MVRLILILIFCLGGLIAFQNCGSSKGSVEALESRMSTEPFKAEDIRIIISDYKRWNCPSTAAGACFGMADIPGWVAGVRGVIVIDQSNQTITGSSLYIDSAGKDSSNCESYISPLIQSYLQFTDYLAGSGLVPGRAYAISGSNGFAEGTLRFVLEDGTIRQFEFVAPSASAHSASGPEWDNLEAMLLQSSFHKCR
ncbi:MAG: hypothetical protein AB7G93_03375 [Bdellovibrionales bacterium]